MQITISLASWYATVHTMPCILDQDIVAWLFPYLINSQTTIYLGKKCVFGSQVLTAYRQKVFIDPMIEISSTENLLLMYILNV